MRIGYSRDQTDDLESLATAELATANGEIRLRIQPQLFSLTPTGRKIYLGWRGVYWNFTCANKEDALYMRDVTATFYRMMIKYGVSAVENALDNMDRTSVESAPSTVEMSTEVVDEGTAQTL